MSVTDQVTVKVHRDAVDKVLVAVHVGSDTGTILFDARHEDALRLVFDRKGPTPEQQAAFLAQENEHASTVVTGLIENDIEKRGFERLRTGLYLVGRAHVDALLRIVWRAGFDRGTAFRGTY